MNFIEFPHVSRDFLRASPDIKWHPGGACILDGTWFGDLKDEVREIHRVWLTSQWYLNDLSMIGIFNTHTYIYICMSCCIIMSIICLWPSAASLGGVFFFDKNGVLFFRIDLLFWGVGRIENMGKYMGHIWDIYGAHMGNIGNMR